MKDKNLHCIKKNKKINNKKVFPSHPPTKHYTFFPSFYYARDDTHTSSMKIVQFS